MRAASDLKWGMPVLGEASGTILWTSDILSGLDYDAAKYDGTDFEQSLQSAFDTWEAVASVDFEQAATPGDAAVTVSMAPIPGSAAGHAVVNWDELGGLDRITSASIELDSLEYWAPGDDGSTALDFHAVALHEIGHIIGLEHVDDPTEIMNPVVAADTLGEIDIESARYLYGTDPGDLSEAPPAPDLPEAMRPGRSGFEPAPGAEEDGEGLFEAVFGWLFDLLESIFGGAPEVAGAEDGPPDIVEMVPDTDPEDSPAPVLTGDVVLIEYFPALIVEEEGEAEGFEEEDEDAGLRGEFVFAV